MPQQEFNKMSRDEKIDYLLDMIDILKKKVYEVADMEEVWEEDILLFGVFKIGTKVRRKIWRPRKEKAPAK